MKKVSLVIMALVVLAFLSAPVMAETSKDTTKSSNMAAEKPKVDASDKNAAAKTTMTVNKARGQERASQIIGMNVRNKANESIGEINDLVLDKDGKVIYVILSHGGFLGIGDKLVPIPWNVVAANNDVKTNKDYFVINMTKAQLEKAPNFEAKTWPSFWEGDWGTRTGTYYEPYHSNPNRPVPDKNAVDRKNLNQTDNTKPLPPANK